MDAKKMLEEARDSVTIMDSNMRVITDTLALIKRVNDNPYTEYRSKNVDKLIDFCEEIIERESKKFQQTVELIGQLSEQKHKTILYLRYIENKSATEVEEIMGIGISQIYRETDKAIKELNNILKEQSSQDDSLTVTND